jgi:hypothetical protein
MTLRVALLAASIFALTPLAQAQEARRVLGGEHLRVHYWPRDEALAQLARETGERALVRLQGMLAAEAPRRIDVYIVASQAEFDDLTGGANDPWIIGRALPSELRVVVKPMGPQRLPGLLAHELAHIMLDVAMGEAAWRLPRWLHEGIAKYAAHDFDQADRQVIARAAAAEKLLGLDDLEAAFEGDREEIALAYAQSYTLVDYLAELEPAQGLRPLLEQIARGRETRQALGLAYGRPVPAIEAQWHELLQREAIPVLAPPLVDTLVGALFVAAFILAVLVARRRSAAIRRRMEAEERLRELLAGVRIGESPPEERCESDAAPEDDAGRPPFIIE